MIIVIADDLSGAAEMAGVAWRFGLTAQIQTTYIAAPKVDVLILNTASRSLDDREAANIIGDLASFLKKDDYQWIYKKVDSVLRGNILAELDIMLKVLHMPRALLVPANPSKGRTIAGGRYLINDCPLDQTDFANDPEYPAVSCNVFDLLRRGNDKQVRLSQSEMLVDCHEGVIIADTVNADNLAFWAATLNKQTLPAGGGDFFAALLEKHLGYKPQKADFHEIPAADMRLFVFGSATAYSRETIVKARKLGIPVCVMPEALIEDASDGGELIDQWAHKVLDDLKRHKQAIITMPQETVEDKNKARTLTAYLSDAVYIILSEIRVGELFIEGGATADTVFKRQQWEALVMVGECGPGVTLMTIEDQPGHYVTIKPGSYPWPETIWNQQRKGLSCA